MIGAVAWTGWLVALGAVLGAHRVIASEREQAVRVCHELRGALTAARLGLELGFRQGHLSTDGMEAVEFELAQASIALDDLQGCAVDRPARAVDLSQLVVRLVQGWRGVADARGVELRIGSCRPVQAIGDPHRLAQAIGNLIVNGIEHGGGVVEVNVRADGDAARIEVTDGGPGLPGSVAELLARRRPRRSTRGRGLAIAAAVAGQHGGWLASAPSDRGARLVLELPAAIGDTEASAVRTLPARTSARR